MNMIRVKTIALSLLALIFLSACTSPDTGSVTPVPTSQPENTILIWWNLFEPYENVKPLIDAYTARNPNVTIQYDQRGVRNGVSGYRSELDTVLNDGNPLTTPDIFTIHNTWGRAYEDKISKAPTTIVSADTTGALYPVVLSDFAYDGVLALPLYVDALAIIYNKDKLLEGAYTFPSDDWLEFSRMATNLTKYDNSNRMISGGFAAAEGNTQFAAEMLNVFMIQNGVTMSDQNGVAVFADPANKAKSEEALSTYKRFVSGSTVSWSASMKLDIASFLEKKLAMFAAPSWRLIDIINYNQEYNLGLNFGVAPLPQLGSLSDTETKYWASYWGQTVSSDSRNSQIAWDFINFISQPEQLRLLDQTIKENGRPIGIIYPRQNMSGEVLSDQRSTELLGPYVQAMSRAVTWSMKDGDIMKDEFRKVLSGQATFEAAQQILNQNE